MTTLPTRSLSILVAEDNLVNQTIARRLLEREGHRVTLAENGLRAVALFFAEAFDLVLMDVQMPEMDGLAATAAIRAGEVEAARPRTPIVALTTLVLPEDRQACIDAGMDHYLSKPVDRDTLARMVIEATRYGMVPA